MSIEKLRWADVSSNKERQELIKAVTEEFIQLMLSPKMLEIEADVTIALSSANSKGHDTFLQINKSGLIVARHVFFFTQRRQVSLTPQIIEDYKISVRDVKRLKKALGISD